MLKELTLTGEIDKVQIAINRLKLHELPEGYYVAFSGGKDSIRFMPQGRCEIRRTLQPDDG